MNKDIGEDLKKQLARIEWELHQHSDFAAAYGELVASCEAIVKTIGESISDDEEGSE
jgi:hypothetical protein